MFYVATVAINGDFAWQRLIQQRYRHEGLMKSYLPYIIKHVIIVLLSNRYYGRLHGYLRDRTRVLAHVLYN